MDPHESKKESFDLPTPAGAAPEASNQPVQEGIAAPEKGPAPELQTSASSSGPAGASYSMPGSASALDPAAVSGASTPLASSVSGSTHELAAEDADLIEKTWVEKAKQIVSETRGDPYKQNKEINKVKADYIKKRYNKDIKLAGE